MSKVVRLLNDTMSCELKSSHSTALLNQPSALVWCSTAVGNAVQHSSAGAVSNAVSTVVYTAAAVAAATAAAAPPPLLLPLYVAGLRPSLPSHSADLP